MKKICVIGSLNMDLVVGVEEFPKPGETVRGSMFHTCCGGKGGNQAVALGKLKADVAMAAKLGRDSYGNEYADNLNINGVDISMIKQEDVSTGVALIEVDRTAQNHIVVVPGANSFVDKKYVDEIFPSLLKYDIFLFQMEVPVETTLYAMKKLKAEGKIIILDPAPAYRFDDAYYQYIDYITPNETEMEFLSESKIDSAEELYRAAEILLNKGVGTVVAKAGKSGAYLICKGKMSHFSPFEVTAVDTTAAGDSFNAGFAYGLALDRPIFECVMLGNAVGGLATTGVGAQAAMPSIEKVNELMKKKIDKI